MSVLSRIGIAIDSDLLTDFDRSIARQGDTNRLKPSLDLVGDQLIASRIAAPAATVVGTVTLIYDHHARGSRGVLEKLTETSTGPSSAGSLLAIDNVNHKRYYETGNLFDSRDARSARGRA